MVTIPPIKMVMTGGWFMALFSTTLGNIWEDQYEKHTFMIIYVCIYIYLHLFAFICIYLFMYLSDWRFILACNSSCFNGPDCGQVPNT